jgi:putative transposase
MDFNFFDPSAETEMTRRHLPHWEQRDAFYFITWRTADSIPSEVMAKWLQDREDWYALHGIATQEEDWQKQIEELPETLHREFYRLFTTKWHEMLDANHGKCLLRQVELRQIIAENLHHQNEVSYQLEAYVVMPNHVHVLVGIPGRDVMKRLCRNWKNYTAKKINAHLGSEGQFWQWESFDHIVRSAASLEKFRHYILENPQKARLSVDHSTAWTK